MALTPEQIQSALKTLKPSQITAQEAPVIMPSTTTPTTNIMPKVTKVVPVSPKQNIMSPSLQVQAWVQPEKDYKALATPQEIATFAKMIRAWEDPEQARRGMQKVIDKRLTQENNARGQEPKKYVVTPEIYQSEQNQWIKNIVGATLDVATWLPRFVWQWLWKWAEAIASWLWYEWVAQRIAWATEKTFWKEGTDIWQDVEAMSYKAPKLIWDIASVATAGSAVSKIPAVASNISKLWSLWTAWKIVVWALEWAWSQWLYTVQSEQRLPTAKELAVWWVIGGAIPALWEAFEWAKKVLPKISDKADDAANKMLTNMNRITKWEQEKFAIQQWKTVWERLKGKWIISWWDESIDALAKWFKASKDKADEWLSLIKWEYKNDYLSTMAREASDFADNTLSPQASRMKELADKANDIWLTMSETNEVKRFFERNNKFTYWRDITAWEKTVRATNLDNYVRNRQLDIAEQNGFSNLKEINKDTQWYKYLLDKLIKNENGRLGNNAVTLTDWIVAGEVAANPQAIALLVWKKVASSNWFRKWVVKILNKLWNAKSEADRLVDIAKIQRIQNEKDLNKFLSLPYKKDANIPTYSLNSSSGVKWMVRPITPTWVIQETKPVLPRATVAPKKTITETGRATHNPYAPKVEPVKTPVPVAPKVKSNKEIAQEYLDKVKEARWKYKESVMQSTTDKKMIDIDMKERDNKYANKVAQARKILGITRDRSTKVEAMTKRYNEYTEKIPVPTTNTTTPKKQSVLPKPQEKQANIQELKDKLNSLYRKENLVTSPEWIKSVQEQIKATKAEIDRIPKETIIKNMDSEPSFWIVLEKDWKKYYPIKEIWMDSAWNETFLVIDELWKETAMSTTEKWMQTIWSRVKVSRDYTNSDLTIWELRKKLWQKQAVLEGKKDVIPKPKELLPLYEEAKKFKSADEFVNRKANMYHGTNAKFDEFDIWKIGSQTDDWLYGRWFYFSPSESYAKNAPRWWAKEVMKISVNTDKLLDIKKYKDIEEFADILDMSSSALRKHTDWTIRPLQSQINQFTSKVQDLWYEWVKVMKDGKIAEVVLFDPKSIKTESQLRKIREEATAQ